MSGVFEGCGNFEMFFELKLVEMKIVLKNKRIKKKQYYHYYVDLKKKSENLNFQNTLKK